MDNGTRELNHIRPEIDARLTDAAIAYAINGFATEEGAKIMLSLPVQERAFLADRLIDLTDQETRLTGEHLGWMSRILRRAELTEHARQIFIDTVTIVPERHEKQGLSERAFTHGRHSSSSTYGW
ncbi:hypothetical protein KA047_03395 [Candidatus Saccharibacteria bacterium]|nr:hypothetical protein [Candidatus Saccharibacteria bacterium]